MTDALTNYINQNRDRYLDELKEILRIPSISTDPSRKSDVERCAQFVAGRIEPRRDQGFRAADRVMLPLMINIAQTYAKLFRRGHGYKAGWLLVAGNNLGIDASLYLRAGGFPHTELSEKNEDRILADRVRTLTDRIVACDEAVVYNSIRRVRAYGYINTLLWYWDRKYRPALVDVR